MDSIKSTRKLSVYRGSSATGGKWGVAIRQAVKGFNKLSRQKRIGVRLVLTRNRSGANVEVAVAGGSISCSHGGTTMSDRFDSRKIHGLTFSFSRKGRIEKAFVFLPRMPQVNTPSGKRAVGPGVKFIIAIHEFCHACGLSEKDHSKNDLFCPNPTVDYGTRGPRADRVIIVIGKRTIRMPPPVLSKDTAKLIRNLWR
jgi:hypothetical protein